MSGRLLRMARDMERATCWRCHHVSSGHLPVEPPGHFRCDQCDCEIVL